MTTIPARITPADLEAMFDRIVELVDAWFVLDQWVDNAPAGERDAARYAAEEAKDEVLAYLSHLVGGGQ